MNNTTERSRCMKKVAKSIFVCMIVNSHLSHFFAVICLLSTLPVTVSKYNSSQMKQSSECIVYFIYLCFLQMNSRALLILLCLSTLMIADYVVQAQQENEGICITRILCAGCARRCRRRGFVTGICRESDSCRGRLRRNRCTCRE